MREQPKRSSCQKETLYSTRRSCALCATFSPTGLCLTIQSQPQGCAGRALFPPLKLVLIGAPLGAPSVVTSGKPRTAPLKRRTRRSIKCLPVCVRGRNFRKALQPAFLRSTSPNDSSLLLLEGRHVQSTTGAHRGGFRVSASTDASFFRSKNAVQRSKRAVAGGLNGLNHERLSPPRKQPPFMIQTPKDKCDPMQRSRSNLTTKD
jgi:hypothetical protein